MPVYKRIYQLANKSPELADRVVLDNPSLPEAVSASLNDIFTLFRNNIPTFNSGGGHTYVNLDAQSSDYNLGVNEIGVRTFSGVQTVPLNVATGDGRIYRVVVSTYSPSPGTTGGSTTAVFWRPNNTTYTGAFLYREMFRSDGSFSSTVATTDAFRIGVSAIFAEMTVQTRTATKLIYGQGIYWGTSGNTGTAYTFSSIWNNTSVAWTSLGTILFPITTSGVILIERIY